MIGSNKDFRNFEESIEFWNNLNYCKISLLFSAEPVQECGV